ncbi:MAG: chemotaxis protein CheW, partial [Chloroflexi bacterium]|nr:chemotaxis protein CheW [Chloroflexota bacterium]
MNLAGELVVSKAASRTRARELRQLAESMKRLERNLQRLASGIAGGNGVAASSSWPTLLAQVRDARILADTVASREVQVAREVAGLIDELESDVLRMRMLPVSTILTSFRRAIRSMAQERGKAVKLVVEGDDTEVDKQILELLADPLVHLVRNAIDHGIEPPEQRAANGKPSVGTLRIAIAQRGSRIIVEVVDDGAGIDPARIRQAAVARNLVTAAQAAVLDDREAVDLIFLPGFTTKEEVSDTSGRGVGLDVVRTNVTALKGLLRVESGVAQGTRFILELPLTLAVTRVLLVAVGGQLFAFPSGLVQRLVRIQDVPASLVGSIQARRAVHLDGRTVPIVPLRQILGLSRYQKVFDGFGDTPNPARTGAALPGPSRAGYQSVHDGFGDTPNPARTGSALPGPSRAGYQSVHDGFGDT